MRMLCLHGYHGSAAILRQQMAPLAAAIGPHAELVYVDAPSLAQGDFGWWHEGFSGWESTRDWAVELLRSGPPFDGIFGFSQGAALTGLLAGLRDSQPSLVQFEFAILVGGFTSTMMSRLGRRGVVVGRGERTRAASGPSICWRLAATGAGGSPPGNGLHWDVNAVRLGVSVSS